MSEPLPDSWARETAVDSYNDPQIPGIDPAHAADAIQCQNACNPCGVMHSAWTIACAVSHEYGTDAVNNYPPYRLMLSKLAELAHLPTSVGDFERDYLRCVGARDSVESPDA